FRVDLDFLYRKVCGKFSPSFMVRTLTDIFDLFFGFFLLPLHFGRLSSKGKRNLIRVTFEAFTLLSKLHTLVHGKLRLQKTDLFITFGKSLITHGNYL